MKKVLRKSNLVAGILGLVIVCVGIVLAGDVIVKEGVIEGEKFKSTGCTATGTRAVAFGYDTEASEDDSTAMGHQTTADGIGSTAMGAQTTANGNCSTAMGYDTTAGGILQHSNGVRHNSKWLGQHSDGVCRNSRVSKLHYCNWKEFH